MTNLREAQEKLARSFPLFIKQLWKGLGLPEPTPLQLDIAEQLASSELKRLVISAFRGCGKSFLTSGYVVWELLRNPDKKILVVSASKQRSDDFSVFCFQIMEVMSPYLDHLKPDPQGRSSKLAFDVGCCAPAHAPSVTSKGITSQLTGSRADLIVADDIEVLNNSLTATMREKTLTQVKEFDSILTPKPDSKIVYLGTPQVEDSLYNRLETDMGFTRMIWPSRLPENPAIYKGSLAPYIESLLETGEAGDPTEPLRFDDEELTKREMAMGRSTYRLQFQLDTTLSDADKYPLKLSDLMVMDLDRDVLPEKVVYSRDLQYVIHDLPCLGVGQEYFYRPFKTVGDLLEPDHRIMAVDPAGRGMDETSYAIVSTLNGQYFVHAFGGLQGGYSEPTLDKLIDLAEEFEVPQMVIESNFGDGSVTKLLEKRILDRGLGIQMEEVRSYSQKEKRIIETLEPLMNAHKVIFDRGCLEDDMNSIKVYPQDKQRFYSLQYQISRISREKGSLVHDDRIDALQLCIGYLVDFARLNADTEMTSRKQKEFTEHLNSFIARQTIIGEPKKPKNKSWINFLN